MQLTPAQNFLLTLLVLPAVLFSQISNESYYPLISGDWREYSVYADGGMIQGLVREGVIDTIEFNNHVYSKQHTVNLIAYESSYVREDSVENILYLNLNTLAEDTLCIFNWDLLPDSREWVVSYYPDIPDSIYGYLFSNYYRYFIPPLMYYEENTKRIQYRLENYLYWTEAYAPGIGVVQYISEGYGKFLERIKIGAEIFSGDYNISAVDTVTITPDQIEFTIIPTDNRFNFDFVFNPMDYNWTSCTIGAIQFSVAPRSEIYRINTTIWGGGINPSQSSITSMTLDTIKYIDCLDERFISAIDVDSDPINISGEYRASMLPQVPFDSISTDIQLMDIDSFEVSLIFTSVTVGIHHEDKPITKFTVHKAYPNPFNPSTFIKYELPEWSTVTLNVYDIQGRIVRTLINEVKPAGRYETKWNGTDESGKQVNGGMYVARLHANNYSQVIKMIYLR